MKEEWQMSLAAALRKLGFTMLREGQDKIIESLMIGDDTIGILPTSGGKSACYQIPGLCKGYKVLIFSPLVALMKDQMESMLRRGLKADQISSGQTPRENISSLNRWSQDLIQFLLVSPERMGSTEFQETMLKFPPDLLVVDEAHCVSQWADSFRPNYRMIGSFIETYNPKQVLAITATCTKEIEADIRNYLKLEHATRVLSFPVRENLHLSSRVVDCFDDAVLEAVSTIRKDPTQPTIIYCATVKNVTAVYDYLCRIGYGEKSGMYHGQLPPDQRNSVQTMFMHNKISIMVATNAFGMGVDKPNIRRVIHLDIPNSIESLSQETGRAGRDGLDSYCISYYYDQALSLQEWFIENKYPEEKYIREIYKAFPRYKKGNSIEVTGSTLAKDLGLNSGVVDSCMNLLISNEIIERENAEDKTTTIKLESNKEDVVLKLSSQKQRFYAKLVDALHSMTITTTDTFSVPIMGLSEVMMETMTTLKNNLKALTEAGVIDYQAPFTGKPFKVLQTLDNFDFKLLALRRATSFRKLKELTQYYFIDDAIKQKFMQDYFTAINS